MPELPEVETVRAGLHRLVVDRLISRVICYNPKSLQIDKNALETKVINHKIRNVRRRGKVLIIDLDSDFSIIVHLKMTGQLVFVGEQRFGAGHPSTSLISKLPDRSTRVEFKFDGGSKLFFNDQRKFGWIKLVSTRQLNDSDLIKKMGPEPLEKEFSTEVFKERLSKRPRSSIKAALLDQSVIAGIGNIYADESLWGAKIHPSTKIIDINDSEIDTLRKEIIDVLSIAIDKGGSTDRNYLDAEGKRGSYLGFARVFRRENQPCLRCGGKIIKIRVAGRGTHLCPKEQIIGDI